MRGTAVWGGVGWGSGETRDGTRGRGSRAEIILEPGQTVGHDGLLTSVIPAAKLVFLVSNAAQQI